MTVSELRTNKCQYHLSHNKARNMAKPSLVSD